MVCIVSILMLNQSINQLAETAATPFTDTVHGSDRWSGRDGAEAVKAFRPSTARRYLPVGLTEPSPAGPACVADPKTKREKSIRVLPYEARARPDQKCDVGKTERASPKAPIGPKAPGWMCLTPCAMPACVLHRTPDCFSCSPPPRCGLRRAACRAASSTNTADACSAGPSGVSRGRRAGTVASPRARLDRPEERHAERAGAGEASTLPPSSRRKVKLCSATRTICCCWR